MQDNIDTGVATALNMLANGKLKHAHNGKDLQQLVDDLADSFCLDNAAESDSE